MNMKKCTRLIIWQNQEFWKLPPRILKKFYHFDATIVVCLQNIGKVLVPFQVWAMVCLWVWLVFDVIYAPFWLQLTLIVLFLFLCVGSSHCELSLLNFFLVPSHISNSCFFFEVRKCVLGLHSTKKLRIDRFFYPWYHLPNLGVHHKNYVHKEKHGELIT